MKFVDLRSDTVTRSSPEMREAIARAEVGDDVFGDDPSVNRLQELAAERVGKEAALLVPTGTMANQVAVRAHTEPGDALITAVDSHVYLHEGGGAAAIAGVQSVLVGADGLFGPDDVRNALSPDDHHYAKTTLVCIENTHNRSGGRLFPLEQQKAIAEVARAAGLALHLDGARLFNAAVASGRSAAELAAPFDSVSFCLSKGLGAPVGSLVCGSRSFVERAHRFRKMLGGGMRQAGVLAAAGIFALEHNVKRLADDHANARYFASQLATIPGVELARAPETNMIVFRVPDAPAFARGLRERGVLINPIGPKALRAVTHLDVDRAALDRALAAVRALAA